MHVDDKGTARELGIGQRAGAVVLSVLLAAFGVGSLWMAIQRTIPVAFGALAAATLLYLGVSNIATLDRQSEYPEGRWLTVLSVLALATGVGALVSPLWPVGLFLAAGGAVGLVARLRNS